MCTIPMPRPRRCKKIKTAWARSTSTSNSSCHEDTKIHFRLRAFAPSRQSLLLRLGRSAFDERDSAFGGLRNTHHHVRLCQHLQVKAVIARGGRMVRYDNISIIVIV